MQYSSSGGRNEEVIARGGCGYVRGMKGGDMYDVPNMWSTVVEMWPAVATSSVVVLVMREGYINDKN